MNRKTIVNFLRDYQLICVFLAFAFSAAGHEYVRQWLFSPKMEINFHQQKPFVINSRIGNDREQKYYPFYQFRISIHNKSKFYKADNHVAMVTGLWKLVNGKYVKEELFVPFRLNPLEYGPKTILPGMTVFAPFGRIRHVDYQKRFEANLLGGDSNKPQFRFEMMDMPRWILSNVEPGKHKFQITVFFDNVPPITKTFVLEWSGKWIGDYDKMQKEIVIKPLQFYYYPIHMDENHF